MRHALALAAVLAATSVSGAALAQQARTNDAGLRYLSWPGKAPALPEAVPQPTRVAAIVDTPAIPLARLAAPETTRPAPRQGLTPASAFLAPAPATVTAGAPQPYAPEPQPQPVQADAAPSPALAPEPTPAPAEAAPPADPMAPRRDAAIFRLQPQGAAPQTAPQPSPQGSPQATAAVEAQPQTAAAAPSPYDQSARYYSVHRQAGRHPDAIAAPRQVWLDALPVQMAQTPASADLAEPDAPPALLRQADGTVRAMPQTQADDLP